MAQHRMVLFAQGALAIAAVALAACGSDEERFDAGEFVEAANRHGASLELGQPLTTSDTERDVYGVEIGAGEPDQHAEDEADPAPGEGEGRPEGEGQPEGEGHAEDEGHAAEAGHAHTGGSLVVTGDSGAAGAEHARCESAVSLLCFRAANVVLIFEDSLPPAQAERLTAAISALGSE